MDLEQGWAYYNSVPVELKKPQKQVVRELQSLHHYWRTFPEGYFIHGMFLRSVTDWDWMRSFIPQKVWNRFEKGWKGTYYDVVLDDKIIFRDLMSYYGLPIAEALFVLKDGKFYREGKSDKALSDTEVEQLLNGCDKNRIFAKRYTGGQGKGIFLLEKHEDGFYSDETRITPATIRELFADDIYFFEKKIEDEPEIQAINPKCLNTIRVTTVNYKGKKQIASACIKFSVGGKHVDNLAQGGIAVPIDVKTGELREYGMKEYDMKHYAAHPDTGIPFRGQRISCWQELLDLVERALAVLPDFRCLGFDIAPTADGPVIIEINSGSDANLAQIGQNRGIADLCK